MNSTSNYRHAAVVLKSLTTATANRFLAKLEPSLSQKIVMEMRRTKVTALGLREAIEKLKSEGLETFAPSVPVPNSNQRVVKDKVLRFDDGNDRGGEESFGRQSGLQSRPNLDFSSAQTVRFEKDPFGFLIRYDSALLDKLFDQLTVRSAAVILSTLQFEDASQRLLAMEDKRKISVMHSIADLEDLHPAEVIDLKFAVRLQIQQMVKRDPLLKPAEVVPVESTAGQNRSPQETSSAKTADPRLAKAEQGRLIASLLEMPDHEVKKLLKKIDTTHLAPALKTSPIALQKKVLNNMAKKPAAILSQQILEVRIDQQHRISDSRQNIAAAIKKMRQAQES